MSSSPTLRIAVPGPVSVRPLVISMVVAVTLVVRFLSSSDLAHVILDGGLLLLLCGWAWLWWDGDGYRRPLKLLSLFNGLFFGIVGLMLVAFEVWPRVLQSQQTGLLFQRVGGEPLAVLDKGLLLVILIQIVLMGVWTLPRPASASRPGWAQLGAFFDRPIVVVSTGVAYAVSQAAQTLVSDSALNAVATWGLMLNVAIVARFVRWVRERGSPWGWLTLLLFKAGIGLFTGWRGRLLELAALLLIAYVAERGRFPIRSITVGALLLAFFLLPFLIDYRSVLWSSDGDGFRSRIDAASAAYESSGSLSYQARFLVSYRFLAVRLGTQRIDELSGIAAQGVRLNGETIWPFLTAPIPRAIWPSKPELSPELNRLAAVLKKTSEAGEANPTTSVVWTQYTDMYLNFGIAGIVAGATIVALLCRWLGIQLLKAPGRTPETVGVFVVFFSPFWGENPMGSVFQTVVQLFMLLGVVLLMIRIGAVAQSYRSLPVMHG